MYLIQKFSWKTGNEVSEAGINPMEIAPIQLMLGWQFFRSKEELTKFLKHDEGGGSDGGPGKGHEHAGSVSKIHFLHGMPKLTQ